MTTNSEYLFSGGGGAAEYQIQRSVRFNSADSAYLSRTPGSAGNRKTWTWAGWVKKSGLGEQILFYRYPSAGNGGGVTFGSDDSLSLSNFTNSTLNYAITTTAIYRDPSAWYHIVATLDTTQPTANNRIRLYVNGVEITTFSTRINPSQDFEGYVNEASLHTIARREYAPSYAYFSGYLADVHFIDGQALDPTSFGEFDTNGVWQPIAYQGTYGTNGFHLPFSNNSTAAALGTDTSGNNNTWTTNNLSVAAGVGNDSLTDTPTNYGTDTGVGGEVRGNYATLNPLSNTAGALSDGNLYQSGTISSSARAESTLAVSSGKWYFEVTPTALSGFYSSLGIGTVGLVTNAPGQDAESYAWFPDYVHKVTNNTLTPYGSAVGVNGVVMVAFDLDNNKIFFGGNGTWFGSSDPATGVNPAYTINAGTYTPIFRAYDAGSSFAVNFGQRPFAYTAPSGYKALCTTNLPEPLVAKPSEVMDVKLYTGNGSTQTISGLGFSPDLVWGKERSGAASHVWMDVIRGNGVYLRSDTTNGDTANANVITSFDSNGFTLGTSSALNGSTNSYAAWCWDAGSSTVTNTQGSITSQVRANPSAGFSIVSWTALAGTQTVGHGLNAVPKLIITKSRTNPYNWWTFTTEIDGSLDYLSLNSTNPAANDIGGLATPTSTVFSTGAPSYTIAGANIIAYCFAPVEGYSAFGSYTGNGSADGPFVYTGFRPRWVMVKRSSSSGTGWLIVDSVRNSYNYVANYLYADTSGAELSNVSDLFTFTANGFKVGLSSATNTASATYIYAAFAENPFKTSRAR